MNNNEKHQEAVNQFIALANKLKDEGYPPQVVSAGLMSASGLYTTYIQAGNEGYLHESGIDKVTRVYRQRLEEIQRFKKHEAENKKDSKS